MGDKLFSGNILVFGGFRISCFRSLFKIKFFLMFFSRFFRSFIIHTDMF